MTNPATTQAVFQCGCTVAPEAKVFGRVNDGSSQFANLAKSQRCSACKAAHCATLAPAHAATPAEVEAAFYRALNSSCSSSVRGASRAARSRRGIN